MTPSATHTADAPRLQPGPPAPLADPLARAIRWVERGWVPDALTRWGIRELCRRGLRARDGDLSARRARRAALLDELRSSPIAIQTEAANQQHYELPPEFFQLCLGPRRKYSACYWPAGVETLAQAEEASLAQVAERAELRDGQTILELGCGWGSLTLWMAERYPAARILAVSNSGPQRAFILEEARQRGLSNVEVQTADMNRFQTARRFERVVSIEMFEHMRNYERLLGNIAGWLEPGGKLFVHIFTHRSDAYFFESRGPADWMSEHFFTGGIMPSDDLLLDFQRDLTLERRWRLGGGHYQRTAEAWLSNLDRQRAAALEILSRTYGNGQELLWLQRWRVFFLACAEMFGLDGGTEWLVSHYRFVK